MTTCAVPALRLVLDVVLHSTSGRGARGRPWAVQRPFLASGRGRRQHGAAHQCRPRGVVKPAYAVVPTNVVFESGFLIIDRTPPRNAPENVYTHVAVSGSGVHVKHHRKNYSIYVFYYFQQIPHSFYGDKRSVGFSGLTHNRVTVAVASRA